MSLPKGSTTSHETRMRISKSKRRPPTTASSAMRILLVEMNKTEMLDQEFADLAGFCRTSIRNWRIGKGSPSIMHFETLANALGLKLALIDKDGRILE